jgi:hypothetical protein
MNLATLCHDAASSTWSAEYDGHVIVKSVGGESSKQYVISRILEGKCSKALKLNVTGFANAGLDLAPSPISDSIARAYVPQAPRLKPNNQLTVEERFELLDECVNIAISAPRIRSLIITGEGSVGKTFHTKEMIKAHGLVSTEEAQILAHTLTPEEQIVANRILERMQECRTQALEYYRKNGLPKVKSEEPEDDEDGDEDEPQTLDIVFGDVDFTKLHTSPEIKVRACGGTFHPSTSNYNFNIKLAVVNPDEYYDQVVPHEIAHHIQHLLFPGSLKKLGGHGKEWKGIMKKVFGIAPDRFHSMDTSDVKLAPDLAGDYHYVKGYTSAKGLYRILFENKKKIVVLDDCDAAWKNEVSANLLKAALDSDDERWISWNVEGPSNEDLPKKFLFDGKVIFISNVRSEDFPQPLITRALRCDVELTIEERFERMLQILPSPKFAPEVDMETKMMAYNFLYDNRDIAAEISSRSLLNVIQVAQSGSKLWKRIALSNIT